MVEGVQQGPVLVGTFFAEHPELLSSCFPSRVGMSKLW